MASLPSGTSEGEGVAHTVAVEARKEHAPLEESDKGARNGNVPTPRPHSTGASPAESDRPARCCGFLATDLLYSRSEQTRHRQ